MWGMGVVAVDLLVLLKMGSMVGSFDVTHFSGGFLNRKMTTGVNRETGSSFSFWLIHWMC